MNLERKKK